MFLARLHLAGIELRFGRESQLAILEAVENFGLADRLVAGVIDGVNGPALGDDEARTTPPLGPFSFSIRRSSKRPVFQSAMKSR